MYLAFAAISGLIHVYIFLLESWFWGQPKTNRLFGVSAEVAETTRLFAFNQGFYNLFLAIAVLAGVSLAFGPHRLISDTLIVYACLSILGAGIVLYAGNRRLWRAALIQGVPPACALILWAAERL